MKVISLIEKKLKGLTKFSSGGRNVTGRITAFHRGGRGRRKYRFVDFWRRITCKGIILKVSHDPNRTAKIGLVFYLNGLISYILLSEGVRAGTVIFSNLKLLNNQDNLVNRVNLPIENMLGSSARLKEFPLGTMIHSLELYPNMGAQIIRAAGGSALLYRKSNGLAYVKLKSGWNLAVQDGVFAVLGIVSNKKHITIPYGKAGVLRNLGFRPVVRGVAMNPIDHPHGGGQGRTSGGPKPLSPWGKLTKWRPTVAGSIRRRKSYFRFR